MKPSPARHLLWAAVLAAAFCPLAFAAEEQAYWVLLADRSEVTGRQIDNWDAKNRPKIAGRDLFDPRNPLLLLRNTRLKPSLTGPRVVFANGDVLPGRLTGCLTAENQPDRPLYLTVQPSPPVRDSRAGPGPILVRPRQVRRIILADRPHGAYRPGILLLAGGGAMPTEAVRWTPTGLQVLTAKGVRRLALAELAEIHMPAGDPVAAVLRDAVGPCPIGDSRILRLCAANGAVMTVRAAMIVVTQRQGQNVHFLVQPTWSADAIAIALADLCLLSARRHDEVPLSQMPAETIRQKSFTGFIWNWRRNCNLRGDLLESGTISADLGISTHSYSAVAFTLPEGATAMGFIVGLDRGVGRGGCVKLKVHRDGLAGPAVWQSGVLRGSDKPRQVGGVNCRNAKRVVLVTEFAHKGRPAGADPADIRDEVNWIIPTVRLDPIALHRHAGSPIRFFPGLADWSVTPPVSRSAIASAVWDSQNRRWVPALGVPAGGLILTRKVRIGDESAHVFASGRAVNRPHRLTLSVGGKPLQCVDGAAHFDIDQNPRYQRWDLLPYKGKEVTVTAKVLASDNRPGPSALRPMVIQLHDMPAVLAMGGIFQGFIVQWQFAGPYSGGDLFSTAYPPEKNDRSVRWQIMPVAVNKDQPWMLTFDAMAGLKGENRVVYLRTNVYSPLAQTARLEMGSDDGIKVWINGQVVHSNNVQRPAVANQDRADVKLRRGWSLMRVKITQGMGPWMACLRFRRPDGGEISGLRFQAGPPKKADAPAPRRRRARP